jgi:Ca-activated chloride channel homolog
MRRTARAFYALVFCLLLQPASTQPQEDQTHLRMNVVLVQLSIAVTNGKGDYVTGLHPEDFEVTEDKIPQKISSFEEGSGSDSNSIDLPRSDQRLETNASSVDVQNVGSHAPMDSTLDAVPHGSEASVFVLFDTSNYMYRGFVFAQDAITDFIRSMNNASRIAFYSYCRDLSRATRLTSDRFGIVNAVRSTVAGDDAALYNSLLLTVKDAAPLKGRKAIVVFSNGPDNASSVPPEDVAELAQSTGTIIYIISTRQAEDDPASAAAFERMSKVSGGKAYFAKNWLDEKKAFASIRKDLVHLYTLSYYPQSNPNRGWRSIKVKLVGKDLQKYRLRTRDGYRLAAQR